MHSIRLLGWAAAAILTMGAGSDAPRMKRAGRRPFR